MEITDKRQAILEAAAKRFSTYGFHETKVEQIAEEAGVAKGTVYLYFKDKNNLLYEVARYNMARYMEEMRRSLEPIESARDKLRAYARFQAERFPQMVQFHKLNFEHMIKLHKDEAAHGDRVKQSQREFFGIVAEVIRFGIERGEFREMDATDAAMIVSGALHAYVHGVTMGLVPPKEPADAEALVDLIMDGFRS